MSRLDLNYRHEALWALNLCRSLFDNELLNHNWRIDEQQQFKVWKDYLIINTTTIYKKLLLKFGHTIKDLWITRR